MWLTIPVISTTGMQIKDVKLNNSLLWRKKHWKSIEHSYRKAEYFKTYKPLFEEIYAQDWDYLSDLLLKLIKEIVGILGIKTRIELSSDLGETDLRSTEELLWYCKKVKATTYFSGAFGRDYLDVLQFEKEGITVEFQDFKHPSYKQLYGDFLPDMSIIDLLFNHGVDSLDIIRRENEKN